MKLTTATYHRFNHPDYIEVKDELLQQLARNRTMIFAFEALLRPREPLSIDGLPIKEGEEYDEDLYAGSAYELPPAAVCDTVNQKFAAAGIEIICYSTNAQLTVIGSQFLREVIGKLLFRIYVPHGRLYGVELDKLLQLFKDYLTGTGRRGISLNRVAAEHGTSYEFSGDAIPNASLADEFADFTRFLEFCVTDEDKARGMLITKEINANEISRLMTRYTREARRLTLDLRQERELKTLQLRHSLESELSELLPSISSGIMRNLIEAAVPTAESFESLYKPSTQNSSAIQHSVPLTVNIAPQIINTVNGVVARQISGNVNLGINGEQLIELIQKNAGSRAASLVNDLHEAGDIGVAEGTRLTKAQRLKSFLFTLAPEVGNAGIHLLEAYLKSKIL